MHDQLGQLHVTVQEEDLEARRRGSGRPSATQQ